MPKSSTFRMAAVLAALSPFTASTFSQAADHGDAPALAAVGRTDAQITDLHVFTKGTNLVLALSLNPAVPPGSTAFPFSSDLTVRFHVDRHSAVTFANPTDVAKYGGTIVNPAGVSPDFTFTVYFVNVKGKLSARVKTDAAASAASESAQLFPSLFVGLRDDPFIRGPRAGRNVGSIVLQLPLRVVRGSARTILAWATTEVPDFEGPIAEHGGRAFRSMFWRAPDPMRDMNTLTPAEHYTVLGVPPDVVIFDTRRPASFPNGRRLEDDVVDLVVVEPSEQAALDALRASDSPFPTTNDVPFLSSFPYLAPPQ